MIILNSFRILSTTQNLFKQNALVAYSVRTLFSEKFLGISEYETHRFRMPNFKVDRKKLIFEMKTNNTGALIGTTKQWIHIMNKQQCESDFMLLKQCLRHIHQNADTSKTYNFGPTVMRMLHYLNLPDQALQLTFDLQIADLFDQLSSLLILCDMLFNNAMYKELLQVIQKKRSLQEKKGMKSSRLQNYLAFATCYKLNTRDHLDYCLQIWNELVKEHQLTQSINFLAMLAINQNQPATALQILPVPDKHFSSINVRLIALCDCGQYAEATQIIQNICTHTQLKGHKLTENVIQKLRDSLDKHPTTDDSVHFSNLLNEKQQQIPISKVTIDEMLCWPISAKMLSESIKSLKEHKTQSELL